MAEHDEHDETDHAAGPGRGDGSVKRVDDPPTLPPFASDGPRPATIHGFPAVDVFGDGGLGDLFDVPKLGARTESAPVPKAAPPPLPPLASRGIKAPPTGPVPIIPQGRVTQSPVAPPPAAKATAARSRSNAPAVREPTAGAQQHDGTDDSHADREPAKPASLPSASSLIEKIRAAKRKEAEQADAAELSPEPKPEPKSENRLVASKAEARPAPPQPPASRPPPPKPPTSTVTAEPRPAPPKPPSSTVANEPRPAPPSSTVAVEPTPAEPTTTAAEPTTTAELAPKPETAEPQAPVSATEGGKPEELAENKVWLEPVPLLSLDRRHEAQASPTTGTSTTGTPPTTDASPTSARPPELEENDGERTIAFSKPSGRIGNPLPPPPVTKPVLGPPPPTTASRDEHQPRIGAPYEPPALVLERSDDAAASEPTTSDQTHPPDHDTESARPRPALPIPGSRRPPLDPMNPIMAARLASGTGEPLADAIPEPITAQDTASLVSGLADEIIAKHEPAANALPDVSPLEVAPTPEHAPANERRRKLALYFLGVAAVLSLIVALLPSKEVTSETEPTPEVADAPEPEPSPSDPTLLAEAQPSEPVAVPVPVDPVPASDTETGAETGAEPEPEPTPVTAPKPKPTPKPTKSEPEPKPTPKPTPKPEPKPEPKPTAPTPGGPDDKRSADELYNAAKAAYNSGRAAEAYKLAYASWRKKDKSKTAELMTLAACKLKDKSKAKSSLNKVTALRRNAIKKDCQGLGLSL